MARKGRREARSEKVEARRKLCSMMQEILNHYGFIFEIVAEKINQAIHYCANRNIQKYGSCSHDRVSKPLDV